MCTQRPSVIGATASDPFGSYEEDELLRVLELVRMKTKILGLPGKLHCTVEETGANFR